MICSCRVPHLTLFLYYIYTLFFYVTMQLTKFSNIDFFCLLFLFYSILGEVVLKTSAWNGDQPHIGTVPLHVPNYTVRTFWGFEFRGWKCALPCLHYEAGLVIWLWLCFFEMNEFFQKSSSANNDCTRSWSFQIFRLLVRWGLGVLWDSISDKSGLSIVN